MVGAFKNPWIVKCSAADGDAGATGLGDHGLGGLGCGHVAVAEYRNGLHRLHDGADAGEIDLAAESLGARAAVYAKCGDALGLQHTGELRRGKVVGIPAQAHLRRHGDFHRGDHAAHECGGLAELGHHRGAAADLHDLAHRAPHVDVDGLGAKLLADDGGVAHLLGYRAEKLDGHWAVVGVARGELERGRVALDERAGVDEIGDAPAEPAEFAHGEAHGQVGVAGQRREAEVGRERVGTEAHGDQRGSAATACFMRRNASVSVLRAQPKLSRTYWPRGAPK
ncbi:MAG: hypothetical protein BWX86_02805 [Verrucomicrobia bacterium ADurb.Bin122]|nr:MAG: hypothetical protein BWX86_02805 [Verrucomicrobia bacterium ADurb.Bin122]